MSKLSLDKNAPTPLPRIERPAAAPAPAARAPATAPDAAPAGPAPAASAPERVGGQIAAEVTRRSAEGALLDSTLQIPGGGFSGNADTPGLPSGGPVTRGGPFEIPGGGFSGNADAPGLPSGGPVTRRGPFEIPGGGFSGNADAPGLPRGGPVTRQVPFEIPGGGINPNANRSGLPTGGAVIDRRGTGLPDTGIYYQRTPDGGGSTGTRDEPAKTIISRPTTIPGVPGAATGGGEEIPALPHDPGSALSERAKNEAEAIIFNSVGNGTTAVTFLKEHSSSAARAEFVRLALQSDNPAVVFQELANAETPEDQLAAANALNAAYDRGILTGEDVANYLGQLDPAHAGEVLAQTNNPQLIAAYADAQAQYIQDHPDDPDNARRADQIAEALSGLPPAELQAYLASHTETDANGVPSLDPALQGVFAQIATHPEIGAGVEHLLTTAAAVTPATAETAALFYSSSQALGSNQGAREAAASFFINHGDEVIQFGQDPGGQLSPTSQAQLAEFFSRTLYTEPAPENRTALQDKVAGILGTLADQLEAVPQADANGNPVVPDAQTQSNALLLGSLIGTLEQSLRVAADHVGAERAVTEGGLAFLDKLADLIDIPLPFADDAVGAGVDALQDALVDYLSEPLPDPAQNVFFELYGRGVSNATLITELLTGRGNAHVNEQEGA